MNGRKPTFITIQREFVRKALHKQSGFAARLIREPLFPEIPQKNSDGIFPFLQERGHIDCVVIGIFRCGPPFHSPLEDGEPTVYPHPVLAVGRDFQCYTFRGTRIQMDILAKAKPCIRGALIFKCGNPPRPTLVCLYEKERQESPNYQNNFTGHIYYRIINLNVKLSISIFTFKRYSPEGMSVKSKQ